MDQERLVLLKQFVEEEPKDPFNWYALALEEAKRDSMRATEIFEHLMTNHPDYLPAYYHAGSLHLSLGDTDKAKEILKTGFNLAKRMGEQKTAQELYTLLTEVID